MVTHILGRAIEKIKKTNSVRFAQAFCPDQFDQRDGRVNSDIE